ncbi:gefF, partial [Symbiodinium natans]
MWKMAVAGALVVLVAGVSGWESWKEVEVEGPGPRAWATFTNVESHGSLLFGGHDGYGSLSDVWRFAGSVWNLLLTSGLSPASRSQHASAAVGKDFYVFGGQHGTTIMSDMWHFEPAARIWSQITYSSELNPAPRSGHIMECAPDQSALFVFGGVVQFATSTSCTHSGEFWSLDLASLSWKQPEATTSLPSQRSRAASGVSKRRNLMFVFGGRFSCHDYTSSVRNDLWIYAFAANSWSPVSAANGPGRLQGSNMMYSELSDQLFIHGGQYGYTLSSVLYQLDLTAGQWHTLAAPSGRYGSAGVLIQSTIVIFGGVSSLTDYKDDAWSYELSVRKICGRGQVFNGTNCSD